MKPQSLPAALALGVLSIHLLQPATGLAQGQLAPSGPPAPGMKTLDQVEPRMPIGALPFTITNSGSFYLTGNLAGTNAITISADDVTLDLTGFALKGAPGSGDAIVATGKRIAVLNGSIRGWGGAGVNATGALHSRFEQLRIGANAHGLLAGDGALVRGCVFAENAGDSLRVASAAFVLENVITAPQTAGLRTTGNNNRLDGNHVTGGTGVGFKIEGTGNLVVRNNARGNVGGNYSIVPGNDFGQILSPGANFTNDVPWANFGPGGGGICGNGLVEAGESCDDANAVNGDGCSATCVLQAGWYCTGSPGVCTTACGDGIVAGGEQCDDGNANNGDGCSSSCQSEGCLTASQCPGVDTDCQTRTCTSGACGFSFTANGTMVGSQLPGDCKRIVCDGAGGTMNVPDNADLPADDGNQCTSEVCISGNPAYQNLPAGAACTQNGGNECDGNGACIAAAVCGNGLVQGSEQCDDFNAVNGDGCSATCAIEPGFQCFGSPSVCTTVCGDGIAAGVEQCDDFNATNGDGCSATCNVEAGYNCVGSPSICTPVGYQLSVSRSGSGSGTVTASPAGINCGADCTESYNSGTMVTLTASPAVGSSFTGWSGGGCTGTGSCVVTMDAAKSVTATFTLNTYTLTTSRSGTGTGTVTSSPAGINCGADCTEAYNHGTSVTLSAAPASGSTFAGWSGGCTGSGSCVVTMDAAKSVTATFTLNTYALTVIRAGSGSGTVTSSPAGINCGADCTEAMNHGTMVTLTATPSGGSSFAGWSGGGCTGTGTCVTTMTAATSVTATFNSP